MKQYRIAAVNEVTYKGQVYGIPEFYDARTIIVDNNVLDMTQDADRVAEPGEAGQAARSGEEDGHGRRAAR